MIETGMSSVHLLDQIRETLQVAALAVTIAAPATHDQLLDGIVRTAAQVIGARSGTLFLLDEAGEELIFAVAVGPKAEEAKAFRVPVGHGIAGLVALTGQAMAISDAQQDPRHARDLAQAIGYLPHSILCLPLFHQDQVVGVLELLDKEEEASFSQADLEALDLFGQQVTMVLELSRMHQQVTGALDKVVAATSQTAQGQHTGPAGGRPPGVDEYAREYQQALDIASMVHQIAAHGEQASAACQTMLRSFAACFPPPYQHTPGLDT